MKVVAKQPSLFEHIQVGREGAETSSSTFTPNMGLPVHRWFRFSAGFSAEWARKVIEDQKKSTSDVVVFDPFGGVGTTILAAEEVGVPGYGVEAQPFIARVARTKLMWRTDVPSFVGFATKVLSLARNKGGSCPPYAKLIEKCYPADVIVQLDAIKRVWLEAYDGSPASDLTWLALASILRMCSPAGTAPWQYVLPRKTKAKVVAPYDAFASQVDMMAADMVYRQSLGIQATGAVFHGDARNCAEVPDKSVTLVVTSPPYTNNYDYADATRLEMTFFGEVRGWGDLHKKARQDLIRSCSQHVSIEGIELGRILAVFPPVPFVPELRAVCQQLASQRLQHGGKKDYHVMVAAYFADMSKVWTSLRRACKSGAKVCFVVGDSAPYGVHVPVDRWLGELAVAAGFRSYRFEKTRDRNVKWKNRKHRVPLQEGRLWVEG